MADDGRPAGTNGPSGEYRDSTASRLVRGVLITVGAILLIPLLPFSVRIVSEYERGVIFRLGRIQGAKGPGLFVLLPFVDKMVKTDLRTVTLDVPSQEVITRDNIPVKVNAVIYFRVTSPNDAVVNISDHVRATSQVSQTALRSVLGGMDLDGLLGQREQINEQLRRIIDEATEPWGVKVSAVELKQAELPATMQRAMATQAETERDRRAKVIAADGEFQASARLHDAAAVMRRAPMTLQLRYLQTLSEISGQNHRTVTFPLPVDLIRMFAKNKRRR